MGSITPPDQVKAIFGLIFKNREYLDAALAKIENQFGPIDFRSPEFPFVETHYYDEEMGSGLLRQYISLQNLIFPDELAHFKQLANLWEEQLAVEGKRTVNLDPGYLGAANLVLASTKNFSQRIYIGKGIYAEVTMTFHRGDFLSLPWTYPDYYHHRDVLIEMRKIYRNQLTGI